MNGNEFLARLRDRQGEMEASRKPMSYRVTKVREKEEYAATVMTVARTLKEEGYSFPLRKAITVVAKEKGIPRINLKRWMDVTFFL